MNQITTTPTSILPAPMSTDLARRVSIAMNGVEPAGLSFTISAEDALRPDDRLAVKRRWERLAACLLPAGPAAAAVALGEMKISMLDTGMSDQEAEKSVELWVKHLADLPAFAIQAATTDFLRGDAGERGFVPKLPVFRQRALTKMAPYSDDKARLRKVLEAHDHIWPPLASPERRAEVVRLARESLKGMRLAGAQAEANRTNREIKDRPPETPQQALARLQAERDKPMPRFSPELRARNGIPEMQETA